MVRVSSLAKLRPWSELTAKIGVGGGSWVGDVRERYKAYPERVEKAKSGQHPGKAV